jgi:hypothetical protein
MRITSSGNVGIGTTLPYTKLVVGSRGTAAATSILAYDGIAFDFYNDDAPYKRHGVIISQAGDASESVLDFNTKVASGTNSTKMTILGNGNVGIGTTSPNNKLTVWTSSTTGLQTALRLNNPFGFANANTGAKIVFSQDRSISEDFQMGEIGVGQESPGTSTSGYMFFGTRNTTVSERMRIFSDGNVFIGSSPSNAGFKLDVNGTGRYAGLLWVNGPSGTRTDTQGINLFNGNVDYRIAFDSIGGTVGYIRYNVDTANSSSHGHIFSAGDYNGTPTNLMLIRADGNVGIGTASPTSRLQVSGSVALPHVTKSANYTLNATDYTVGFDCASNRTATLPDATTCAGRVYVIYHYNTGMLGSRYVTIDPNGSQTINGLTTFSLQYTYDFSSVMIQSNGSNWIIISDSIYYAPV